MDPAPFTTAADLIQDLRSLGVADGRVLMVHSSLSSLGKVLGCAFRRLQPSIPIETSHLFRSKPAGDSDDPSRVAARIASG